MRLGQLSLMGLLAVGSLLSTGSAFADTVYGTANIAGAVTVTENSIVFGNPFYRPVGIPGQVQPVETGSFASLVGGTFNKSLTGGPMTGNVNVSDFMTFDLLNGKSIDFDLTYIAPGVGTADGCSNTLGQSCTIANSPFTLRQDSLNPNSVDITLRLDGQAYYSDSKGTTSSTVGLFTTQIASEINVPDSTVSGLLSMLASGGSISGASYSATFSASPTPEPASWLLMSAGLLGAGFIARRKAQAAKSNA